MFKWLKKKKNKNMYIYIYEREIPDFEKLTTSLLTKVMKINYVLEREDVYCNRMPKGNSSQCHCY